MRISVGQLAIGVGIAAIVLASVFAADSGLVWMLFAAYFLTFFSQARRYTLPWCPAVLALLVVAGSAFGMEEVASWLWSILMFIVCAMTAVVLILAKHGPQRKRTALISALSLLCIASVPVTHWPFRLAFVASRPSFEAVAKRLHAGRRVDVPGRIGRFTIEMAEFKDGRACLWTSTRPNGFTGFVRNPYEGVNRASGRYSNTTFNLWSYIILDADWAYISED